ncbi:hypothetical protein RRG08_015999 [Elysia crispata]|uniref:Uncharacterized protein n=1 Tax=Elysia crispata TaxID=231223 RepID=A0AAE0XZE0_9GAST|nr:hypothetical protein RRG08_015999 [Elysia crispata]
MAVKEALSGRGHQPWCCGRILAGHHPRADLGLTIWRSRRLCLGGDTSPGLTLDLQYGGQGGSVWAGTPALVLWSNLSGHHPRADLGMTERPCLRPEFSNFHRETLPVTSLLGVPQMLSGNCEHQRSRSTWLELAPLAIGQNFKRSEMNQAGCC